MRTCIPDIGPNVVGIRCYRLPHLVDRFLDVHSGDNVYHQQPHVRLSERFPRANPPAEPKDGVDLLSGLRIHLACETLRIKLLWLWIELLVPGYCPGIQSAKGRLEKERPPNHELKSTVESLGRKCPR